MSAEIVRRLWDEVARIKQHLKDVRSRAFSMVARGVVQLGEDNHGLRQLQVGLLANETRAGIEHMEHFGLTAAPMSGAEALVIFIGGNRDHPMVIATPDRTYRPQALNPGESCLYSAFKQTVLLDKSGNISAAATEPGANVTVVSRQGGITLSAPNGTITIQVGGVTFTLSSQGIAMQGNLSVQGNVSVQGTISATGPITGNV